MTSYYYVFLPEKGRFILILHIITRRCFIIDVGKGLRKKEVVHYSQHTLNYLKSDITILTILPNPLII